MKAFVDLGEYSAFGISKSFHAECQIVLEKKILYTRDTLKRHD